MKYLVVGDIHGCVSQLEVLLQQVPAMGERRMVFLGDYVDVGPDASRVVETLVGLRHSHPDAVFLQGNHDFALYRYIQDGDFVAYARNGGIPTIRSYAGEVRGDVHNQLTRAVPRSHMEFLEALEPYYETADHLFSHAGYDVDDPESRSVETMVLVTHRRLFTGGAVLGKLAVCGHYFQPTREPFVGHRVICLDTGCGVLDGPLSALLLPEFRFLQVHSDLGVEWIDSPPMSGEVADEAR